MAAPLSRTWYNALVDDTGDGISGTVWNKAQVNGLLNTVDASLGPIVDRAGTPAAGQLAVFEDGDTVAGYPAATLGSIQAALALTGSYPSVVLTDPAATAGDQTVRLVNFANAFYIIGTTTLLSLSRSGGLGVVDGVTLTKGAITFPAVPTPNAGATTLDEYREFSWIPTITGGAGGSGTTYGFRDGAYTKVGRTVTAQGRLSFVNAGTFPVSVLLITDLPFLCGAMPGAVTFSACDALGAAMSWIGGSVIPNQAYIQLKYVPAGGSTGIQNMPTTALTNSTYLEFTAVYQAAQ